MNLRCLSKLSVLSLLVLGLLVPSAARASNIVADGDFATSGAPWFTTQTNGNFPWGWGGGEASTGCIGSTCITGTTGELADLDQDLTTTPGDYTLSFTYNPAGGTPTELEVLFGGAEVTDLVNVADSTVTYSYDVVATSASTELTFLGRQDPGFDTLTDVDRKSVV